MNIPKKIKVGGHDIKVVYPHYFSDQSDLKDGVYNSDVNTIYLAHKGDGSRVVLTLIHEVLHAIDEMYNSEGLTEEQVLRLSEGLYQVLKDNKTLRNVCS